ncbi:sodium:solute symporter family protein [Fibrobacter succinogenes]|uniref:Solute:Na+ symporter, SSS family n=1 Tax=Fibrobacter succinogenes TaxID=833 RepID=A0A380S6L1_FIBSU|nr:sodium:solute symporter [Fibrobacter succinogenes]PWJ34739.1 SSS family solute:Na+ symporter [Fibrobacter succinogenes subsp. elongatus]SUQ24862.1 solute:Na+ symporter, SSS family [Fibrobacter succinogenes]
MKLLLIYFFVLGFICIRDLFKVKNFDDYVVAGRKQSSPFVFMSLMATVLGASATVGIAARAESIGFAAFWWLAVGTIGFWFQAAFLSKPVHDLDVRTLPEIAEKTVGKTGRKLVALIIAVSWIGIIAAQFAAVAGFIGLVLGHDAGTQSVLITAVIVIVYTLLGGQLSVVRTDALQFGILTLGFFAAAVYLFGGFSGAENAALQAAGNLTASSSTAGNAGLATFGNFNLLNEKFGASDLAIMLFTIGGAYFLGPDVISRNLVAKNATSARKAVVAGSFAILAFSVIIVLLGMWAATYAPATAGSTTNPLFRLASGVLPLPLAALLSVGLLSALLSSADTCLINSAAIFGSDILNTRRISVVRISVVVIGIIATYLALQGKDIIGLLTMAYSVYTPGIVAPLAVAIIAHKKFKVKKTLWYAGVIIGGLFGLIPAILASTAKIQSPAYLPLVGIAISLVFALASLKRKN